MMTTWNFPSSENSNLNKLYQQFAVTINVYKYITTTQLYRKNPTFEKVDCERGI